MKDAGIPAVAMLSGESAQLTRFTPARSGRRQALLKVADPSVLMLLRLAGSGLGVALCSVGSPTHQALLASDTESAGDRLGEGPLLGKSNSGAL